MTRARLAVLLAVLVAPGAMAIHPGTFETTLPLRYVTDDHTVNLENPGNGDIHKFNANVGKRHDFVVENASVGMRITVTSLYAASSDGVYNVTFSWNGTVLNECYFHLLTRNPGGFLTGDFPVYTYHQMFCLITGANLGNSINATGVSREVVVNKTVISGTPDPIEDMHMNFEFLRTDEYIVAADANEILETIGVFGPLLVVIALVAFSLAQSKALVELLGFAASGLVVLITVATLPDAYGAMRLPLVVLGLMLLAKATYTGFVLRGDV